MPIRTGAKLHHLEGDGEEFMIILSLFLSFLGFMDAAYLTILHYKNVIPPCSLAHGCETVLTSKFATSFGIPISLIGIIFYLAMLGLLGMLLQSQKTRDTQKSGKTDHQIVRSSDSQSFQRVLKKLLLILTTSGLIVSALLVYLQAFVIHAYCQYCLASEGINLLLFIIFILFPLLRRYE